MRVLVRRTLLVALALSVVGCTSFRNARKAEIAFELGNWDDAVLYYLEAVQRDPSNIKYRAALLRAKIEASQQHFEKAKKFREAGLLDRAMIELQQAVELDPTNQYAEVELGNVREEIAAQRENAYRAGSIAEMKERTRGARPQPPTLNPRSDEPISMSFPEPVSLFQVYRALGKAFGINILFDQNLKDQEMPIELEEVTARDALEHMMRTAGHFYKVLDEHTILIAADSPQNRRIYEDLMIQTFFLSNAEVKDMLTILRSMIDARKIATNDQLNAIILRDTADKVKIAEKIIQTNDKARAEVVIDVELLQIDTSKLRELGVSLSQFSITQSLDLGGDDVPLRVSDIDDLTSSNWILTIPNFVYNFVKSKSDAQLLAKPRLRITEGERARLVIGDRVPIPVTTFNTGNTIGGNVVPITSFQYQEVGIQIQIEPRVHHNKEVSLQVQVEVSNISGFIEGSGGQQQPRIGTRTIDTTIRLRDGETNFLAGLIRTDETQGESGIPGLSDIPLLGRLFSNKRTQNDRTDVILTLTPHIIRNAEITEEDLLPIWVGTEANISFRGGSPRVESEVEGPFDSGQGTPEEIQERMRQRIQRLPRGLRPSDENQEPEEPPGVDLAPGSGFTSIFDNDNDNDQEPEPEPEPEPPPLNFVRVDDEPRAASPAVSETSARDLAAPEPALARASAPAPEARPSASASSGVTGPTVFALGSASDVVKASEPAVNLRLVPGVLQVAAGDRFEVRLNASTTEEVSHLPVTLTYDPRILTVESVSAGTFLGDSSEAEILSDTSVAGRLMLGASRLGERPGVVGSGEVARIAFRALAEGAATVSFAQGGALSPALESVGPVSAETARIVVSGLPGARHAADPRAEGTEEP